jgi:putative endonuclease
MRYHVYIMSSKSRTLYIGVTGSLMSRVLRHKAGEGAAFSRKYRIHRLVYFHAFQNIGDAIARETEIKDWRREKKVAMIREFNPTWEDLAEDWASSCPCAWPAKQIPPRPMPLRNDKSRTRAIWRGVLKLRIL